MTAFTDDDVTAGIEAFRTEFRDNKGEVTDEMLIEAILAAVAPAIAARALREAADEIDCRDIPDPPEDRMATDWRDGWELADISAAIRLRARAEQVES